MARGVVARADGRGAEGLRQGRGALQQHLAVVPDDVEVQIKYADAILKIGSGRRSLQDALAIYESVLKQYPGRDGRAAACGGAGRRDRSGMFERAREPPDEPAEDGRQDDGHLEYLMGRCYEQDERDRPRREILPGRDRARGPRAARASQRLAILLRDKLGQRRRPIKVIDEMVKSAPGDYRVYLERGRYRERDRTLRAPGRRRTTSARRWSWPRTGPRSTWSSPDAASASRGSTRPARGPGKGLATAPKAVELYLALRRPRAGAGRVDRAIETLELGLKACPRS